MNFLRRLFGKANPSPENPELSIADLQTIGDSYAIGRLLQIATGEDVREKQKAAEALGAVLERKPYVMLPHLQHAGLPRAILIGDQMLRSALALPGVHWAVVAVCSFHPNGWVREAAVKAARLEEPRLVPYIALRTNDWVRSIADHARRYVLQALRTAPEEILAGSLYALITLKNSNRYDNADYNAEIDAVLLTRPDAFGRIRNSLERSIRLWGISLELRAAQADSRASAEWALSQPDPAFRLSAAYVILERFSDSDALDLLPRLVCDPTAKVRLIGLEIAEGIGEKGIPYLETLACDVRWHLRAAARFVLEKRGVVIDAEFYSERLTLPGAISGLAETGSAEHAPLIAELLAHENRRVRREAVWALGRLDAREFAPQLAELVGDSDAAVAREAVASLRKMNFSIDLELVEWLLRMGRVATALEASAMLNKWETLRVFILATPDEHSRHGVEGRIRSWLDSGNISLLPPTAERLDLVEEAVEESRIWLDEELADRIRAEVERGRRSLA